MADDLSDAQLVARVQRGERAAFDLLVRKYQHRVIKLVSRYVSPPEAQDVAQDAFIKAYRSISGFKGDSAFYTWLYRISINSAKNYITARSRRPASQDVDVDDAEVMGQTEQFSDRDTPEALAESHEVRDAVLSTIRDLPEELRTAITLRELDGMSYDQIAETMGCPVGTVRSRIFRARSAVERRIAALSEK